jgi:hypothetical protein
MRLGGEYGMCLGLVRDLRVVRDHGRRFVLGNASMWRELVRRHRLECAAIVQKVDLRLFYKI